MNLRVVAVLLVAGMAALLFYPIGPSVAERQTGHLKSGTAGVVARSAFASESRLALTQPAAKPAEAKPKAKARAPVCSPADFHCQYCAPQKERIEKLAKDKGYTAGKADTDDFQFLVLGGREAREKYGIGSWPTTVFLDADGKVVKSMVGLRSAAELEAELLRLRK